MSRQNSPARRHIMRHTAVAAALATAVPMAPGMASNYELMLAQLAEHRHQLKGIQSTEAKAARKLALLPEYDAYIDGALASDAGGQDDIITTLMVWHIDAGSFERAVQIGEYVIRHGLAMPDQYKRSPAAALVEETAEAAIKAKASGEPFDLRLLNRLANITSGIDMHDQIRAKLHKAIGLTLGKDEASKVYLEEAVIHLTRALELHDKSGVKKEIEAIERRIKAIDKEQASASTGAD